MKPKAWKKSNMVLRLSKLILLGVLMAPQAYAKEFARFLYDMNLKAPNYFQNENDCGKKPARFFMSGTVKSDFAFQFGPLPVFISERAQKSCSLNKAEVMSSFGDYEDLNKKLNRLRDNSGNVQILVDDLSDSPTKIFRFFIPSENTIYLDCRLISQKYVIPSLAHELTHVMIANHQAESWFEEMLAQLMEAEVGGWVPLRSVSTLSERNILPPVFLQDSEFGESQDYGISFLMGNYLLKNFGGWETLRSMLGETEDLNHVSRCDIENFRKVSFQRGQSALAKKMFSPTVIQRFTPKGLLRQFAVAATQNIASNPYFQIPGWSTPDEDSDILDRVQSLKPSQFLRLPVNTKVESLNKDLEIYLVEYSQESFRIGPPTKKYGLTGEDVNRFYLLINTSDRDIVIK